MERSKGLHFLWTIRKQSNSMVNSMVRSYGFQGIMVSEVTL